MSELDAQADSGPLGNPINLAEFHQEVGQTCRNVAEDQILDPTLDLPELAQPQYTMMRSAESNSCTIRSNAIGVTAAATRAGSIW